MSVPLIVGLILQGLALFLIARKVRHRHLAYNGLLFVVASVLYHGIGEFLQRMFPDAATYRQYVGAEIIDRWVLIVGVGIFLFAATYSYSVLPLDAGELETQPTRRTRLVYGRWILPAVLLGHVSVSLGILAPGHSTWESLVLEFLPALTAIALVTFSDETGGRHSVSILLLLCLAGTLSGQRGAILLTLLLALSVLLRDGWSLPWGSLRVTALTAAMLALLISATRADVGREEFKDLGLLERLEALGIGFGRLVSNGPADTLLDDFVYRIDGNSFGGLVLAGYEEGIPPSGWRSFSNNLYLAVPSALNPAKLEQGTLRLDEEDYLMLHFGMPGSVETGELASIDYLPTFWGVLFGDVGVVGTMMCAPLLGWAFALADSRCVRRRELAWVLVGYWLTASSIDLEQGFRQFFTLGRSVLVLAIVVGTWGTIRRLGESAAGSRQDETEQVPASARIDREV
jgi:hypothetical protein